MSKNVSSKPFHICFCCDANYLKCVAVTVFTLLNNAGQPSDYYFHILTPELSAEDKETLDLFLAQVNTQFGASGQQITVDESIFLSFDAYTDNQSRSIYYRLLLPELLDKEITKYLYLDCDLMICGDVKELFETDIDDYVSAACPDWPLLFRDQVIKPRSAKDKKHVFSKGINYFNSGVMLINRNTWVQQDITKKCFDFLSKYRGFDQDALNYSIGNLNLLLPIRWNYIASFSKENERVAHNSYNSDKRFSILFGETNRECRKIIHFAGDVKPWHLRYSKLQRGAEELPPELRKEWISYALKTPVYGNNFELLKHAVLAEEMLKGYSHAIKENDRVLRNRIARVKRISIINCVLIVILFVLVLVNISK